MVKFYVLRRDKGGEPYYAQEEGYYLPARCGLEWYIYHDTTSIKAAWYVVEGSSGLSVAEGKSRSKAMAKFEEVILKLSPERLKESCAEANRKYGGPPNQRITYLHQEDK